MVLQPSQKCKHCNGDCCNLLRLHRVGAPPARV